MFRAISQMHKKNSKKRKTKRTTSN